MPYPGAASSYAHDAARARLGALIAGRWRLDELLGVGGIGAVYAGTHRNGNRAAIKLIKVASTGGDRAYARLRREARAANKLASHGAVIVLDDGIEGDELFLVMELLEGDTLAARARASVQPFPVDELLRLGEGMLAVLAAAHERGIVHRDVKPENVFVTHAGAVRMLDFGLARVEEPVTGGEDLTSSGVAFGTPAFMAPEQARGCVDEIGPSTDVWCAGATLFTLLTGRFVHVGATTAEMLFRAGSHRAPPISTYRPDVPRAVASAIDRALAFDGRDRLPHAGAMLAALRTARCTLEQGDSRAADAPSAPATTLGEDCGLAMRSVPLAGRTRHARSLMGFALLLAVLAVAATSTLQARKVVPAGRGQNSTTNDPIAAREALVSTTPSEVVSSPQRTESAPGTERATRLASHIDPAHTGEPSPVGTTRRATRASAAPPQPSAVPGVVASSPPLAPVVPRASTDPSSVEDLFDHRK